MAYQAARGWGMQPSEFWALPIADFWTELDGHAEMQRRASGKPDKIEFTAEELDYVNNWRPEK